MKRKPRWENRTPQNQPYLNLIVKSSLSLGDKKNLLIETKAKTLRLGPNSTNENRGIDLP
jgi:hypothetical protein